MLCLADIQLDIFSFTILSDDHTGVNLFTRSDKESTTLLGREQTVSYRSHRPRMRSENPAYGTGNLPYNGAYPSNMVLMIPFPLVDQS